MPFGSSVLDANGIPLAQGYVPSAGFKSAESSLSINTDGSSNASAPLTFHHSARTVFLQISTAITATPVTNGPYVVGPFAELAVDINITAKTGTTPTIQFFIDRIGADGITYNIWTSAVVNNLSPAQVSTSIGSGFTTNLSFGATAQFRWAIGGSATPGYTFSVSIIGK